MLVSSHSLVSIVIIFDQLLHYILIVIKLNISDITITNNNNTNTTTTIDSSNNNSILFIYWNNTF